MSSTRVFVARLVGCVVFDPAGDRVGKVRDVLVVYRHNAPPLVTGLIVDVPGLRRVFLHINRITSIAPGAVITTGLINLRRFSQRGGETRVVAEIFGRQVRLKDGSGTASIEDVCIERNQTGEWRITQAFLRRPKTSVSPFAKGPTVLAKWSDIDEQTGQDDAQDASHLVAAYSELKPADLAVALLELPEKRRFEVAEELSDDRLADLLEELSDIDQAKFIAHLSDQRAATVVDHMEPDDAADALAQLPAGRSETILRLMKPEEAADLRMLLQYSPDTAGGLMNSEPVICSADATVAEALALIRREELASTLATMVCVTMPPYETPTGRYLGMVHFQKLLRYPPHERVGTLLDNTLEPLETGDSIAHVAKTLASYDLVSVPVVDGSRRLMGIVTVDDVLDHLLPDDWRTVDTEEEKVTKFNRDRQHREEARRAKASRG